MIEWVLAFAYRDNVIDRQDLFDGFTKHSQVLPEVFNRVFSVGNTIEIMKFIPCHINNLQFYVKV